MWVREWSRASGWLALPVLVGCASTTGPGSDPVCTAPEVIGLGAGSCVVVAASVSAHPRGAEVVSWVTGSFNDARIALGLDEVEIRLSGDGPRVVPEVGVGGFATDRTVDFAVDLDTGIDPAVQREWVEQVLAHELHHVARLRVVENPRTLGALVAFEGLADHFSLDFGGQRVPPWASALAGPELTPWVDQILDEHPQQNYSVQAWMFGTTSEIPRWTGYSAGYAIVGEYLGLTGRTAAAAAGDHADDIIGRVRSNR